MRFPKCALAFLILLQPSIQQQFLGYNADPFFPISLKEKKTSPLTTNESIGELLIVVKPPSSTSDPGTRSRRANVRNQLEVYCNWHPLNLPCYTRCRRRSICDRNPYPYRVPNNTFRSLVVKTANKVRSLIAKGDPDLGFPPAANMRAFSYDRECEFFAGCFLKTCYHTDTTVKLAINGAFLGSTGYGIISFYMNRHRIGPKEIEEAFMGWKGTALGPTKIPPFNKTEYAEAFLGQYQAGYANDFLQLANAHSHLIGCATYSRMLQSNLMYYQFSCIYSPAIKFHKQVEIYKHGEPATACQLLQVNKEYPLLCGEIRPMEDDFFVPFADLNRCNVADIGNICLVTFNLFVLLNL